MYECNTSTSVSTRPCISTSIGVGTSVGTSAFGVSIGVSISWCSSAKNCKLMWRLSSIESLQTSVVCLLQGRNTDNKQRNMSRALPSLA